MISLMFLCGSRHDPFGSISLYSEATLPAATQHWDIVRLTAPHGSNGTKGLRSHSTSTMPRSIRLMDFIQQQQGTQNVNEGKNSRGVSDSGKH
jgi:hypothetical protein